MAEPTANETTLPAPLPVDPVVHQFAPKKAREPEKSPAQILLERLVAARTKLALAGVRLSDTLETIRGPAADPAEIFAPTAPLVFTEFFGALDELTGQMERLAAQFETTVAELARRF